MKKVYFLFFFILLLFINPVFSQNAFHKGNVLVDAGISIGVFGYGFGARHAAGFPVPLTAAVEYGLSDVIGIGPYAGYLHQRVELVGSSSSFTTMAFGGQAVFHVSTFLNEQMELTIDEEKVDLYAKAIVGYERYGQRINGQRIERQFLAESGKPVFGAVAGARYMLNPTIGAFAEAGRGIFGWLNMGVSLRF